MSAATTAVTSDHRARPQTPSRRWWPAAVVLLGVLATVIVALLAPAPRGRVAGQPLPPGTFVATMGYEPTTLVLPDGAVRIAKPTGTCSSLWGGQPFSFTPACQAHDYGYDVLRHAAADGTPLPASARRDIDAVFAHDLHATCAADERGLAASECHGLARVWVAAVRLNSWRQHDGPPGREPVTASLLAAAALLTVALGSRPVMARLAAATAAIVARTPPERDCYADLVRTVSILIVVLGHWLMIVVTRSEAGVVGDNLLAVAPALHPATWLLQVLPVVFFVGGFANLTTWRRAVARGTGVTDYLIRRVRRLAGPTVVLAWAWMAAGPLLRGAGVPAGQVDLAARLVAQPLWFLAVYLAVAAVAPLMSRLHTQFGARVVWVLALATVAVDAASIGLGVRDIGGLNVALVWLCVHQCGFFYADVRIQARPQRRGGGRQRPRHVDHLDPRRAVPGQHGRGAWRDDVEHDPADGGDPRTGCLPDRCRDAAARTVDRCPGPTPRVVGGHARRLGRDDAVPVAPHRCRGGTRRGTRRRRAAAGARRCILVARPTGVAGDLHPDPDTDRMSARPVGVAPRPPTGRRAARTLPAVTATVAGVAGCACLALAGFTSSVTAFTGTVLLTAAAALTRGRGTTPTAARSSVAARVHET